MDEVPQEPFPEYLSKGIFLSLLFNEVLKGNNLMKY